MKDYFNLARRDTQYFSHIDGLRALGAFRVMLTHIILFGAFYYPLEEYLSLLKNPLIKFIHMPSVLLDSFFVISGLVIAHSLIKTYQTQKKVDIYQFFVRRGARIFPLYIFTIIIALPLYFGNLQNLWANVFFVNNHLTIPNQYATWTWAIAVEVQFYLIFGLVMWLLSKKIIGAKICTGLIFLFFLSPFIIIPMIILKNHYYHLHPLSFVLTQPESWQYFDLCFDKLYIRCTPILYGVLSAYLLVYHQNTLRATIQRLSSLQINAIVLALIALLVFTFANDPSRYLDQAQHVWQTSTCWTMLIQHQLLSLALCLFLVLANYPKGFLLTSLVSILNSIILRFLGRLSYTIYLIHPVVFLYGFPYFFATHTSVSATEFVQYGLWLIFLTILIAIPSYLLLEKPLMKDIIERYSRLGPEYNSLSKQKEIKSDPVL